MINWKVRIKNKNFWLAIIPAVLLLITQVGAIFGIRPIRLALLWQRYQHITPLPTLM